MILVTPRSLLGDGLQCVRNKKMTLLEYVEYAFQRAFHFFFQFAPRNPCSDVGHAVCQGMWLHRGDPNTVEAILSPRFILKQSSMSSPVCDQWLLIHLSAHSIRTTFHYLTWCWIDIINDQGQNIVLLIGCNYLALCKETKNSRKLTGHIRSTNMLFPVSNFVTHRIAQSLKISQAERRVLRKEVQIPPPIPLPVPIIPISDRSVQDSGAQTSVAATCCDSRCSVNICQVCQLISSAG